MINWALIFSTLYLWGHTSLSLSHGGAINKYLANIGMNTYQDRERIRMLLSMGVDFKYNPFAEREITLSFLEACAFDETTGEWGRNLSFGDDLLLEAIHWERDPFDFDRHHHPEPFNGEGKTMWRIETKNEKGSTVHIRIRDPEECQ